MFVPTVFQSRQSHRLGGYDYSRPGMYFVTLCLQDRRLLLGRVIDGRMEPNAAGKLVSAVWNEIPQYYPDVALDAFQLMPNHLHGILILGHRVRPVSSPRLGEVIRRFKMLTTRRYVEGVRLDGWPAFRDRLWQRDFYDHIVRGDRSLEAIRRYVAENPARWDSDPENPAIIAPRENRRR
jgi:putative transposase